MTKNIYSLFVFFFLWYCGNAQNSGQHFSYQAGAIVRGDSTEKTIALVFTGHDYAEGGEYILEILRETGIQGSFFFTGDFYRNPSFETLIKRLEQEDHYLGAHSDRHLLYCDWSKPDSLLVTRKEFSKDLLDNYAEMSRFGVEKKEAAFFLPPYEWYNDSISTWTRQEDLHLVNITYGTLSHADYTTPKMSNYRSSETIYKSILKYEENSPSGLNGFILLVHIGVGPERKDKFYLYLDRLLPELKARGYCFVRIDRLLKKAL